MLIVNSVVTSLRPASVLIAEATTLMVSSYTTRRGITNFFKVLVEEDSNALNYALHSQEGRYSLSEVDIWSYF